MERGSLSVEERSEQRKRARIGTQLLVRPGDRRGVKPGVRPGDRCSPRARGAACVQRDAFQFLLLPVQSPPSPRPSPRPGPRRNPRLLAAILLASLPFQERTMVLSFLMPES